ncbi:hypothetical protein HPP92_004284 [Vanilla planifolia]|uniref:Uncharacterized protein n=1 Tax=Vanilla planifolia TaxID=51239 RepID=A0A835S951_VANPL|nr:hypothetical protein HPP92_004284 [Vanilla planifolia]
MPLLLRSANCRILLRFLLFWISLILRIVLLIVSPLLPPPPSSSSFSCNPSCSAISSSSSSSTPVRALLHVLSLVSVLPVSSRKYGLVRSLADRLLDENLLLSPVGGLRSVNRVALSDAFACTIRRLEAAVASTTFGPADLISGVVWSSLRWIGAAEEESGAGKAALAEKLAAEVLWLAQKMADCGSASEAAVRWAAASGLGRIALSADPRIQVALVRVSVFMFKQAHRLQAEWCEEGGDACDGLLVSAPQCCVSMLRTWLPLLCRAGSGVGIPILEVVERAEMLRVLEGMVEMLDREQQEEILALWLHHFTLCPESDWPNLESYYAGWYAESRKLVLQSSL